MSFQLSHLLSYRLHYIKSTFSYAIEELPRTQMTLDLHERELQAVGK